jgi:hypothetical protein
MALREFCPFASLGVGLIQIPFKIWRTMGDVDWSQKANTLISNVIDNLIL